MKILCIIGIHKWKSGFLAGESMATQKLADKCERCGLIRAFDLLGIRYYNPKK